MLNEALAQIRIRWMLNSQGMSLPVLEAMRELRKQYGVQVANGVARIGSAVMWQQIREGSGYVVLYQGEVVNITWNRVTISIGRKLHGRLIREKKSVSPKNLYVVSDPKATPSAPEVESPDETLVLTTLMRQDDYIDGKPLIQADEYAEVVDGRIKVRKLH